MKVTGPFLSSTDSFKSSTDSFKSSTDGFKSSTDSFKSSTDSFKSLNAYLSAVLHIFGRVLIMSKYNFSDLKFFFSVIYKNYFLYKRYITL